MNKLILVVMLVLAPQVLAAKDQIAWRQAAQNLSAGEAFRAKSLKGLRSQNELEKTLTAALRTEDRYLALDVIAALNMNSMLNTLIDFGRSDDTGFFYLTINTLANAGTIQKIADVYRQRLLEPDTAAPVRMVLLDSLARMEVQISYADLDKFLNDDPSPEVRSAAISYLRHFLLNKKSDRYRPLLDKARNQQGLSKQRSVQLQNLEQELLGQKR